MLMLLLSRPRKVIAIEILLFRAADDRSQLYLLNYNMYRRQMK